MISCIYSTEVHSGDAASPHIATQVVALSFSKDSAILVMNPSAFTPPLMRRALAARRRNVLTSKGAWKCACGRNASHALSSMVLARSEQAPKRVLSVTEKIRVTCGEEGCADVARQKRNIDATNVGGRGAGFRFAFRCAQESLRDLSEMEYIC